MSRPGWVTNSTYEQKEAYHDKGTIVIAPVLPRTLGELVDRLSIINVKLFVAQDAVHDAANKGIGLDAETVKKLAALNMDRSKTMNAIDALFADSIKSGTAPTETRVKIG